MMKNIRTILKCKKCTVEEKKGKFRGMEEELTFLAEYIPLLFSGTYFLKVVQLHVEVIMTSFENMYPLHVF